MAAITDEQKKVIDSLVCERLSKEGTDNIRLIDDFFCVKGEGLVRSLQNEAFSEDENNTTAYYVVKHPNGDNISRVGRTFSGIELSHFCSNNQTDDLWDEFMLPQSRGTIIFWRYVVDIVLEIVKLVGCQYIFLFAADMTPDGKLISHYKDQMNFSVPDNLATAKPVYDFACKFMCNEVSNLKEQQRLFFANFNPDSV